MPKETLRIDSHVLQPWREIAGILGMTVSGYVGRHLDGYRNQIQAEGLVFFAEEVGAYSYETRELAQSVADRFEAFAIEAKLEGRPNIGTISTAVVPTDEGRWNVKVDYLSPSAKRGWHSVSEDDRGEGDDWKS